LKELVKKYEYPYKARDAFLDFHRRDQRWAVLVCHRRAGKTVATIADTIRRAIMEKKENARYAYIAPYYAQAKNIAWDYLLKFAEPAIVKANQSELWVELVNGAKIRLFGADNPDALRGLYLDGVVLDEYADMKPRLWGEIVRPLLTDRQGWATFIGTPKGHNSFYDIYNEAQKNPNWYVKTLRADQSGLIPEAELLDAQATMSSNQYEQEFLCSFEAAILGAYYGQEMRRITDMNRITCVDYDPMFPCNTAWDLGFNDSTAIIWFQVVYGEIYGSVQELNYSMPNGAVAFRAFDLMKDGRWIDWVDAKEISSGSNLPWVPILKENHPYNFDEVCQLAEGKSTLAPHVREGCVVQSVRERWNERVGRAKLKWVGCGYLEKSKDEQQESIDVGRCLDSSL